MNSLHGKKTHQQQASLSCLLIRPDLKLGGRSVLVNQIGFDNFCRTYFNGETPNSQQDVYVLRLLDTLPSLDPFIVREHLARNNVRPAPCYLKISQFDQQRMTGFANEEIERLVKNAFDGETSAGVNTLVSKILSNEMDASLVPLRHTFRMTTEEFADGIFSWRGFLYFKWRNLELQEEMRKVLDGLGTYQPIGKCDDGTKEYLREVRPRLARKIVLGVANVGRTIGHL